MKLYRHTFLVAASIVTMGGSLKALDPVDLGSAANYVILAKTAITTTVGSSIVGDLGISPAARSDMTGFDEEMDGSGQFATSSMVTGKIFAADMSGQTETDLTAAVLDMEAAYTDAAGRSGHDFLNLDGGNLSSTTQPLTPGLYNWDTDVVITDSVTIDGLGDSNSVWIFQITKTLTLASATEIFLAGNANAENIFWQTAEGTTVGTGSHFIGNLLSQTNIAIQTDATVLGRLLAQSAVTLESNDITVIPEPATYVALFGLAAISMVLLRRRTKQAA